MSTESTSDDVIDVIITAREEYEVIEQAILSLENLQVNSIFNQYGKFNFQPIIIPE